MVPPRPRSRGGSTKRAHPPTFTSPSRRTTGHTIIGEPLKGSAELRCQARHTFPFPPGVNALDHLLESIADPRPIDNVTGALGPWKPPQNLVAQVRLQLPWLRP